MPGGETHALIYAQGAADTDVARYWEGGAAPTSSVGKRLKDHEEIVTAYSLDLSRDQRVGHDHAPNRVLPLQLTIMPTPEQVAYFAGFFDGEGSVICQIKKRGLAMFCCLSNTEREPLELAQNIWGGTVSKCHGGTRRTVWQWVVCGKNSEEFVRDIYPWSIVKQTQLAIYLELRSLVRGPGKRVPISDSEFAERRRLHLALLDERKVA